MTERLCSICEKPFDPGDLEYVELGKYLPPNFQRSFHACHNCAMNEKLSWYTVENARLRDNLEASKAENNAFRTLMMKVETMAAIGNEPAVSTRSYILQHRPGWEALPIDTLMLFLDLYNKHVDAFTSIITKKASEKEIQAHLKAKTEEAQIKQKEVQEKNKIKTEKQKVKDKFQLKNTYANVEEMKAVKSLMKFMSEDAAYAQVVKLRAKAEEKTNG